MRAVEISPLCSSVDQNNNWQLFVVFLDHFHAHSISLLPVPNQPLLSIVLLLDGSSASGDDISFPLSIFPLLCSCAAKTNVFRPSYYYSFCISLSTDNDHIRSLTTISGLFH